MTGTLTHGSGGGRYDKQPHVVTAPVTSKWHKRTGGPAGDKCQNLVADPISAHEGKTYSHEGRNNFRLRNVVDGIRRLTPRECERLQGLDDDWTAGHADTVRYRCIGNAMAVPVVQWIASRLREGVTGVAKKKGKGGKKKPCRDDD